MVGENPPEHEGFPSFTVRESDRSGGTNTVLRVPFSGLVSLIIHFIGLYGKRYFEALEHYLDVWYTWNHGKHHHHRNHEDAGNHS